MRLTFLLGILLVVAFPFAAKKWSYAYDSSGNMISRTIVLDKNVVQADDRSQNEDFFEERVGKVQVRIYPNPVESILTVNVVGDIAGSCQLYGISGILLGEFPIHENIVEIDMGSFVPGDYLLHVVLGDETSVWKIIKK